MKTHVATLDQGRGLFALLRGLAPRAAPSTPAAPAPQLPRGAAVPAVAAGGEPERAPGRVSPAAEARQPRPASRRRRVLIVEDDPETAQVLELVIAALGHEATVATDGVAALESARSVRPDVVLCDIGLPRLDGYDVARAIRADVALARVFLVAVTAYSSYEDQLQALAAGFDRHVSKPIGLDTLRRVLADRDEPRGTGTEPPCPLCRSAAAVSPVAVAHGGAAPPAEPQGLRGWSCGGCGARFV